MRARTTGRTTGIPTAYWWILAGGWIILGVVIDAGNAWATAVATVTFGAVHAAALSWALPAPTTRDPRLPRPTAAILAFLGILAAATVALGALASEDGADHPVTAASVVIAVALVAAGPRVVDASR